jgi:hypothetical protein
LHVEEAATCERGNKGARPDTYWHERARRHGARG